MKYGKLKEIDICGRGQMEYLSRTEVKRGETVTARYSEGKRRAEE
jgi:hypothetical protein